MPLSDREYMRRPHPSACTCVRCERNRQPGMWFNGHWVEASPIRHREASIRGRSAKEQQVITANAYLAYRLKRRIKTVVKWSVVLLCGIVIGAWLISCANGRNESTDRFNTFITQLSAKARSIQESLEPTCDTTLINTIEVDRKAEIRIAALMQEEGGIRLRAFMDIGATANDIERMQRRIDSNNREIDELKRKRIQYQRIISEGCIGAD